MVDSRSQRAVFWGWRCLETAPLSFLLLGWKLRCKVSNIEQAPWPSPRSLLRCKQDGASTHVFMTGLEFYIKLDNIIGQRTSSLLFFFDLSDPFDHTTRGIASHGGVSLSADPFFSASGWPRGGAGHISLIRGY